MSDQVKWKSKCGRFRIVVGAYGEPQMESCDTSNLGYWSRVYPDQTGTLRIDAFEAMMHSILDAATARRTT